VPGEPVARGQLLVELTAMEMVQRILAPQSGRIRLLLVQFGDVVEQGTLLLELEE
jgi:biotin carboxyl carrier protein